jgi:hypothetical protein
MVSCSICAVEKAFAVTYQEGSDQVASADQALRVAFNGVVDAEQSGSNVSALLARLNDAASDLTKAETALAAGDYSNAASLAATYKSLANEVGNDASVLKSDAIAAAGN